jgi:hypothetical protein
MNLVRWTVAAVMFGASASSLAQAGTHAGKSASRHARHHHQAAAPAPVGHAGTGAAVAPRDGASADGANGAGRNRAPNGTDAPAHKGARAIPTLRDHPSFVTRTNGAAAAGNGHAGAGSPAQHGINPDLIFVPPPGRNARFSGKPAASRKAAAARPTGPTGYHPARPEGAMAAAKNAIGVAMTANAGINPIGADRTSPRHAPVGEAGKTNAIGAHIGAQGLGAAAPGSMPKAGTAVGPASTGHPGSGPTAVAALSSHGGGISGTGLHRPGIAPAAIGGPAKLVAGIGGTGMRSKR